MMSRDWPFQNPLSNWIWKEWEDTDPGYPRLTQEPSYMEIEPVSRVLKNWTHNQAGLVKTERKPTGELIIKAHLPGVNREDVRLDLKEGEEESILTLTAEKAEDHVSKDEYGGTFSRSSVFKILRSIPLGSKVSVDDVKADLADDQLLVEVKLPPVTQKIPSSRIDIHSTPRKTIGTKTQPRSGKVEAMDTDINKESSI